MWKRNLIKTLFIFLSLDVCCAWNPRLYPYDPRIHNFGNHGAMGSVHSLIAPLFTLYTDTTIYGRNLRKEIVDTQGTTKTILDVGCGTGFSTSETPGSKGLDVSKEMLSAAKAIFPNKEFEQGDIGFLKDFIGFLNNILVSFRMSWVFIEKIHLFERTISSRAPEHFLTDF